MAPKRRKPGQDAAPAAKAAPKASAKGAAAPAEKSAAGDMTPRGKSAAARSAGRSEADLLEALNCWLSSSDAKEVDARALYRAAAADLARMCGSWVAEKGDAADPVADALGFPSPFVAVSMADRKGVWQPEPPLRKQLGESPESQFRPLHSLSQSGVPLQAVAPAGLKNLGATCYLNSLLQYLFFNTDFRYSLLAAESSSEVVQALQKLFAAMQEGQRAFVDPSEFIRVTGVDAVEQEDATEFATLLLEWLEKALGKKTDSGSKGGTFISELFQGEVSQVVTCLEQGDHVFERREEFIELRAGLSLSSGSDATKAAAPPRRGAVPPAPPPAVITSASEAATASTADPGAASEGGAETAGSKQGAGRKRKTLPPPLVTLEDLLAETVFLDEMLCGSNKYMCAKCDRKVDARKSTRLAKAPAYLHVTVQRYHYDQQKGERRKLNNPVSFPQHLRLRLSSATDAKEDECAAYDCVGFLEHVSDSAHHGHYTATLYQEDEDVARALALASDAQAAGERPPPSADAPAAAEEPTAKRRRCDEPGCAPRRRGMWWSLDDLTVNPVSWKGGRVQLVSASSAGEVTSAPADVTEPARIESSSAYLVLYRRRGAQPPGGAATNQAPREVPASLATSVSTDNSALKSELSTFRERSAAVDRFLAHRREAMDRLLRELRAAPTRFSIADAFARPDALPPMVVVPTAWFDRFVRGEDRDMEDLLAGRLRQPEVSYSRALLDSATEEEREVLDPLAVWCGEVKLVPSAVFDQLGGAAGLDSSMFLPFEGSEDTELCKAARTLHRCFQQEWLQIRKIVTEAKVSVADARRMQAEGAGDSLVWLPLRLQRMWQKMLSGFSTSSKVQAWEVLALRAFLREVQEARWGTRVLQDDGKEDGIKGALQKCEAVSERAEHSGSRLDRCEVSLTDSLLCPHGLVANQRVGFLVKRQEVELLLQLSAKKAEAYRALWPHVRAVPQYRAGLHGELLPFQATCAVCQSKGAAGDSGAASGTTAARQLCVKRRYPSKVTRKVGQLPLPDEPSTGASLRNAVRELLSFAVSSLRVELRGEELDLGNEQQLDDAVDTIIVEKDESDPPAKETAAFSGSVFRNGA